MKCKYCSLKIENGEEFDFYGGEYWHVNANCQKSLPILEDEINKPGHYHKGGIDVIGFAELHYAKAELRGFYRINCIKYLDRYDKKGGISSLKKCEFYLHKLMELENE